MIRLVDFYSGELVVSGPAARTEVAQRTTPLHERIAADWLLSFDSENTISNYRRDVRAYFEWCAEFGLDPLRTTPREADGYRRFIADGPLAESTRARRMASVSSFYKFGMTRFPDEVQSNPFGAVRRPKVSQKSATRSLSMDQTLDLFDAAEASGPWDAVVVHVLLATGMRVSELVNAKVGDVKQHGDHHVVEIKRKGAKPDSVPLSPEALAAIRAYVGPRTGGTILLGDGPDGRSNRRAVGRALDRLARVVGVPLHPHRLRHTAATRALAAGATIERVSEMLGHDSILTTMRYLTSENAVDQSAVHELAEAYRSARETRQSREHCHNAFDDAPAVDSVNR